MFPDMSRINKLYLYQFQWYKLFQLHKTSYDWKYAFRILIAYEVQVELKYL